MGFVLDASVGACWTFVDEDHPAAAEALRLANSSKMVVPRSWWFEIRNILIVNERRKRITETETHIFLRRLDHLQISVDHVPNEAAVIQLARHHALTLYDSSYLELALRQSLPLATLERKLAAAATLEGVRLIG
jgi:predicted nucleic acid-binding protein